MMQEGFIGRSKEFEQIRELIHRPINEDKRLVIQTIEGEGGVGKSSVLLKALDGIDLAALGYLKMELTGVARDVMDANGVPTLSAIDQLLGSLIASAASPAVTSKPPGYYFNHTNDAMETIAELRRDIRLELAKRGFNADDLNSVKALAKGAASVYKTLSSISPKAREFVDPDALENATDMIDAARFEDIKSIETATIHVWERMGLGSSAKRRSEARRDAGGLLANAFVSDLKAIVLGKNNGHLLMPGHGKVPGLKRVLIVVDDFEALSQVLDRFLVDNLLSALKSSSIPVTVFILTRDNVDVNPRWKEYEYYRGKRISLKRFSESEVKDMLIALGVESEAEHSRAWRETNGLPYHLSLWREEFGNGGRNSESLLELYQRVTMWMSDQEIKWLHSILYLKNVRVDTLEMFLGDENQANAAFDWYEREGSIRGMGGMNEFVRSRLKEYLLLRNVKLVGSLKEKADIVNSKALDASEFN